MILQKVTEIEKVANPHKTNNCEITEKVTRGIFIK